MARIIRAAALAAAATLVTAQRGSQSGGDPCAQIGAVAAQGGAFVDAGVAYACLQSVPFVPEVGIATVENFKKVSEFHSTLGELKNPGPGYESPAVDIIAELDAIIANIQNGQYANEYDFEAAMASVAGKSYDGHFNFHGNTFQGAVLWHRGESNEEGVKEAALISISTDGAALPQVYMATDLFETGDVSAVSAIDGTPIQEYLEQEMAHQLFQDPDARWNTLFKRQQSDSEGAFVMPWFYPGEGFEVTFANSSTRLFNNFALLPAAYREAWAQVTDGNDFYAMFVDPSTAVIVETPTKRKRDLERRTLPTSYPQPEIEHPSEDIPLGGFFLDGDVGDIAVLTMNTFSTSTTQDGINFQRLVEEFLNYAVAQGKSKLIVDVSSNGGGSLLLGYDVFKQLFPSIEPDIGSRVRMNAGVEIMGEQFGRIDYQAAASGVLNGSGVTGADIYTSNIHWSGNVAADGKTPFTSWDDMNGPVQINGSPYSELLRYNFADPNLWEGWEISGYGSRTGLKQYFKPEDIVVVHDGYCASTCAIFSDLMRRQGGVRSYALGGRPQTGPMQPVGGTKGSLLMSWELMAAYIDSILTSGFAETKEQLVSWANTLPQAWPIMFTNFPSVNFRNAYHPKSDRPMQFLKENANCRFFYTPAMARDITAVWETVARHAWNIPGGNAMACVAGSETAEAEVMGEVDTTDARAKDAGSSAAGLKGKSMTAVLGLAVVVGVMVQL